MSKNILLLLCLYLSIALVLPFIWLKSEYIYTGEENAFANYALVFDKHQLAWSDRTNFGAPTNPNSYSVIIPSAGLFKVFDILGFDRTLSQKLILTVYIFCGLSSISAFLYLFTNKMRVVIMGAFFYFFSFYTIATLFYSAKSLQLILVPLIFVLYYKFLKTQSYKYFFLHSIVIFLSQALYSNFAQFMATIIIYPIAWLYFVYMERKLKIILASLFLISVLVFSIQQSAIYYYSYVQNYESLVTGQTFRALTSPLALILLFRGSWWENQGYEGVPYNHLYQFFNSPLITIFSFALIAIALSEIFLKQVLSKSYKFLFILFLISLALSTGTNAIPEIFMWLYNNVPFFYIFREPWSKFIIFALLFSSGMFVIVLDKLNRRVFLAIIACLLILRSYPFFSNTLFDYANVGWKKTFIKPPPDWYAYDTWTKNNADSYVLPFPYPSERNPVIFRWNSVELGNTNLPMYLMFGRNNFISTSFVPKTYFLDIMKFFEKENSTEFIRIFPIDYMLKMKDSAGYTIDFVNKFELTATDYFENTPSVEFGDWLSLHKIKTEFEKPFIYSPKAVTEFKSYEDLFSNDYIRTYGSTDAFIITKQQKLLEPNNVETNVSFNKTNETLYEVTIETTASEFYLVARNTYNSHWEICSNTKSIFPKACYQGEERLIANGYSNGWVVDTKKLCALTKETCTTENGVTKGTFQIFYKPQYVVDVLEFTGGLYILIVTITYLLVRKRA